MKVKSLFLVVLFLTALIGCEAETNIPRDEIPLIKESVTALENVIKRGDDIYFDSLASSEVAKSANDVAKIHDFIFSDGPGEFSGFTEKQIVYREDIARVDCKINSPDGPGRAVTITFKKEGPVWLFKNIEAGQDEKAIPIMPDTTKVDEE
ncbi:MAG: hypothetical protein R3F48_08680 [Candidatus Zixiibacteriota bacterium]